MSDLPALLNISDAARELGVNRSTVRRWIDCGEIPSTLLGRTRWVARATVQALADGKMPCQTGTPPPAAHTRRKASTTRAAEILRAI